MTEEPPLTPRRTTQRFRRLLNTSDEEANFESELPSEFGPDEPQAASTESEGVEAGAAKDPPDPRREESGGEPAPDEEEIGLEAYLPGEFGSINWLGEEADSLSDDEQTPEELEPEAEEEEAFFGLTTAQPALPLEPEAEVSGWNYT
jgi:hypothetical protein